MKVILTETQKNSLDKIILRDIEFYLKPYGGWKSPIDYKNDIRWSSEVFFFLVESEGSGEDKHMYYSLCLYEKWDPSKCPSVSIPHDIYNYLTEVFGDYWKNIFKEWFKYNTELDVKEVISQ